MICASARAEIVIKCIREYSSQGKVTVIAPAPVYAGLAAFQKDERVRLFALKAESFNENSIAEMQWIRAISYETAIVVSGGLGFIGFDNVIKTISGLKMKNLVFYNKMGHKELVKLPYGMQRVCERYTVPLLMCFFACIRPIELAFERIYIRCAELLDL